MCFGKHLPQSPPPSPREEHCSKDKPSKSYGGGREPGCAWAGAVPTRLPAVQVSRGAAAGTRHPWGTLPISPARTRAAREWGWKGPESGFQCFHGAGLRRVGALGGCHRTTAKTLCCVFCFLHVFQTKGGGHFLKDLRHFVLKHHSKWQVRSQRLFPGLAAHGHRT